MNEWAICSLGELLSFEYGKSLSKSNRISEGDYPVIGSNGIVGYHSIFLCKGPGIVVGRKGAAGEVTYLTRDFWPIDTTYYIKGSEYTDLRFIYYLLKSLRLKQYEKSTAIPGLNRNDAYRLKIYLPPLPEQRAIVAKLETLLSELDNAAQSLKQAKEQIKTYRQTVLKAAFTGKLTEEWRKQQTDLPTSEELLQQINDERQKYYEQQLADYKAGKIKTKPKQPEKALPLKTTEDWQSIPANWIYLLHNQIAEINPRLPYDIKDESCDVSFIPMSSVEAKSGKFSNKLKRKYSDVKKGYTPFINGDVIFAKITPCMENGKIAIVNDLSNGIGFGSTEFHVSRLLSCFNNRYLLYYLLQDAVRDKAKMKMSGGVGQLRVSSDYFGSIPIPCCSKREQDIIVNEIDTRFSVADQLDWSIEESLVKAEALKQSLLKQAFEGKLLSEEELAATLLEPDWEPAEKLLARIKAEKSAGKQLLSAVNHSKSAGKRTFTAGNQPLPASNKSKDKTHKDSK